LRRPRPRPLQITTAKIGENWVVFPAVRAGPVRRRLARPL